MASQRSRVTARAAAVVVSALVVASVAAVLTGPAGATGPVPAEAARAVLAEHPLTPGEALAQARRTGQPVDVVGSTTATDLPTALPNGALRRTTSLLPQRRYTATGWRDLDATLRVNADGSISPTLSTSDLRLSGGGSGPLARMSSQTSALELTLPLSLPAPTLAGDTATYSGVLPGVDLVVRADRQGGFSQVLVVHNAQAARNPALASLTMATGGDARVAADPDGSLAATDRRGRPAFIARAPIMWDSTASTGPTVTDPRSGREFDAATGLPVVSDAREPGAAARQARVEVSVSAAGIRLVPDASLLSGRGVNFPLYIDPTWTPVSPTRSAWATVAHTYPNSNYWNDTPDPEGHLQVGNSGEGVYANAVWSRSFLNFAIPVSTLQGATINSATLNMTQVRSWSCNPSTVNLYAPDATLTSGNATWSSWSGVNLGSVVAFKNEAHGYNSNCPAAGVAFDVLTPINAAVTASKTTQTFVLAGVNESTDFNSWKEFDLNTVAMTVEYNHTPNTPGAGALTTSPPTSCLQAPPDGVGLGNVSLYAQVTDPEAGNILGVEFQVWRTDTPGTIVMDSNPSNLTVPSGSTAVLVVPRGTLEGAATGPTTDFSWRVRATDTLATSGWSPVCRFVFDQTALGAPTVPEIVEGTTTIGQVATLTVSKPDGSVIPSGYRVQLNGGVPTTYPADASGNATIRFTPTRHTNVLSVVSLSPVGNVGLATVRIFVANPGPSVPDGDITGDGVADLVTVGGTNNLGSGLWVASGRGNGQVDPAATNIGVRGIGLGKHDDGTDYDDAIALTGQFFGSGQQDHLVYLPTGYRSDGSNAGGGSILEGRGDGSVLSPFNQATITAGLFEWGDGSPTQLVNAGDTSQRGLAYPDLLGIVGVGAASYLDYYPNDNMVGGWGTSQDPLAVAAPSGDWSDWTIVSAQVSGGTSLYLWRKATGELRLWAGLTHTVGDTNLGRTSYTIAASGWNTGATRSLSAGDIDGDGDADLWTVDGSGTVRSYLLTISGSTATLSLQPSVALTTATHAWSLADAPAEMGSVTVAHDQAGTADLTGSNATWNTGDLFSPDIAFDGSTLSHSSGLIGTAADFSVSLWVKPADVGGVVLSQGGSAGYGLLLSTDASDDSWRFALSRTDAASPVWDVATSGADTVQVGVWTQVTATYQQSSGEMRLYLNGVYAGGTSHPTSWASSGTTFGARKRPVVSADQYFEGQLASIQTWNQVIVPPSPASYYQPMAMTRLVDTRDGTGGLTGPLAAGSEYRFKVAGAGGVPATNVSAVALVFATVGASAPGYLTAYPDGTPRPATSVLNWPGGNVRSNTTIVPVGANGYVRVYVHAVATHLIVDVQGHFTTDPSAAGNTSYTPVTPTRYLDTRDGTGGSTGKIPAYGSKALQVGGTTVGSVTIPSGVRAVAINLVAVNQSANGFLVTYADGTTMPSPASGLQIPSSGVTAQLAIVPVGSNGKIRIYTTVQTDLIGDIVGYFADGTGGQKFHAIAPVRMLDTRTNGGPVAAGATRTVSQGAIVAAAPTLVLNATVTDTTGVGYVVAYPHGPMPSPYSTINYSASQTIGNLFLGATGGSTVDFTNASGGATVQLIIDCNGYLSTY